MTIDYNFQLRAAEDGHAFEFEVLKGKNGYIAVESCACGNWERGRSAPRSNPQPTAKWADHVIAATARLAALPVEKRIETKGPE